MDDRTSLVLQTGDLIQGDTASVEMHMKMLERKKALFDGALS